MSTWAAADLHEICRPKQWPTISMQELTPDGYPVYGANGQIGFYTRFTHEFPTILITCRGATCGTINLSAPKSYVTGNAMALDALDTGRVDQRYLYWYLQWRRLDDVISGTAQPQITREGLRKVSVLLPSLTEQRRIADILDRAEALRAKRRAALAQLDELTRAVFSQMCGGNNNASPWASDSLGNVTTLFGGASLPTGVPYKGQTGGYLLIKVSDMNTAGNEIFLESPKEWSSTPGPAAATIPPGAIVIPKRGGAIGTNKKRLSSRPSVLDPNLMGIVPRLDRMIPEFLFQWFLDIDLLSIANGSSVPQLNKKDLEPLQIPVPPLPLQQEFARRVQAIDRLKVKHRQSLAEMDALFLSLQHRAFRGEL
ncbi:MAG: restriction endonuclease subunit S [Vulcanimicrobiota bacterium]